MNRQAAAALPGFRHSIPEHLAEGLGWWGRETPAHGLTRFADVPIPQVMAKSPGGSLAWGGAAGTGPRKSIRLEQDSASHEAGQPGSWAGRGVRQQMKYIDAAS